MNDKRLTDELKSLLDELGEIIDRKVEKNGGWARSSYCYGDPEIEDFFISRIHDKLIPIAKDLQFAHELVYNKHWRMSVSVTFVDGSKFVGIHYKNREFSVGYFSSAGKFLRRYNR